MEKELIKSLLDEIVKDCETIKSIKEKSNSHVDLRKLLKKNYDIDNNQIESFLTALNSKIKQNPNKQIEKLHDKILNLCSLINISYKDISETENFYSKIRSRVSNMRQSIKKRNLE